MNTFYQACKYTEVYFLKTFLFFFLYSYLLKEKWAYSFKPNKKDKVKSGRRNRRMCRLLLLKKYLEDKQRTRRESWQPEWLLMPFNLEQRPNKPTPLFLT